MSKSIRKEAVFLFLSGKMNEVVFLKAPKTASNLEQLHEAVQNLLKNGKEISAENIFLESKNREILVQYMGICNEIDLLKLNRKREI